jgi:hypothetical protein
MANTTVPTVTPEEVAEIIERASKEPGINDVLALMELSREAAQIEQIRAELAPQPLVTQVTGTAVGSGDECRLGARSRKK